MRFERVGILVLMSLVFGPTSCKDLVMPAPGGEAGHGSRTRVTIVEVIDGIEKIFVEPVDIVLYDDENPLSAGGLQTSAISTRGFAEFEAVPRGVYSVAMIHPRSFAGVRTIPNQYFEHVSLPGDVTLRVQFPSLSGNVVMPAELASAESTERLLRLSWEEWDPRSLRYVTLRYTSLVAADGSFSARLPEGEYAGYFDLTSPSVSMHRHISAAVALDSFLVAAVDLQLEAFPITIDFEHPDFPADSQLHLAIRESDLGWSHTPAWSSSFTRDELPIDAWLGRTIHRLDLVSKQGMFFDRVLWWDPDETSLEISLSLHRVDVEVLRFDGTPASSHSVEVWLGGSLLPRITDVDGRVRVFLERGVYQLEAGGLDPQNLKVDGDLEFQLSLPDDS